MTRTVLVVDDAEVCATLLEIALSGLGETAIRTARNGSEALAILAEGTSDVAALVTDLDLPRMDGFELIERIRAHPELAMLPVIVISGLTDGTIQARLQSIGVHAYFQKPCSPLSVRRVLENLLNAV